MIIALRLPLKVPSIILGCIFSMLFSDFRARGPIGIPTPSIVILTEFFHADAVASVHPLPVSWYLMSLLYMCSWMHIMSMLWAMADEVSSGSCPILFNVLTLNVAICIVCLHLSNFYCLSSVADFSNTEAMTPTSAGRAPFLPAWRAMQFGHLVWLWVMFIFQWLFFSHLQKPLS